MSKTLRELEQAATPAPWDVDPLTSDGWALIGDSAEGIDGWDISGYGLGGTMAKADAAFIAAFRNKALLLLDVVDAAELAAGLDPNYREGIAAHRRLSAALAAWDAAT